MNSSPKKRLLPRLMFGFACLATLVAISYWVENWRGQRAWEKTRRELEAKGVSFEWSSHIPPQVPDEQNVFKAPRIAEWFVKGGTPTNDLSETLSAVGACLQSRSSNLVAVVTVVPETAEPDGQQFDCVLGGDLAARADSEPELQRAIRRVYGTPPGHAGQNTLDSAQGFTFTAFPTNPTPSIRVAVRGRAAADERKLALLFQHGFDDVFPGPKTVKTVPSGPDQLQVFLTRTTTFTAIEYLACSDLLLPQLDLVRAAFARPHARPEGNYDKPWATPVPGFVAIRNVAQALAQRAQAYLLVGKPERALEELTLLHDMRRLLEAKPTTLVSAMINVAITGLYVSVVGDGLRLGVWRDPELQVLDAQLGRLDLLAPVAAAFEGERIATCRLLEGATSKELSSIFSLGPDRPGLWARMTDPEYLFLRWMPRGWVFQNMASIAMLDERVLEMLDTTNQVLRPKDLDTMARQASASLERTRPYNFLARSAMPNFEKALHTTARNQSLATQARIACALERYRNTEKRYPANLGQLVPGYLQQVPADVIDGASMKYRSNSESSYVLYSVGWNQTDEGGTPGKSTTEGDWVLQPSR